MLDLALRQALELIKRFHLEYFIFHYMLNNNVIKRQNCIEIVVLLFIVFIPQGEWKPCAIPALLKISSRATTHLRN